jgi:cystathionine beta-synthase
MTKFLADEWMYDCGFVDEMYIRRPQFSTWWAKQKVADLDLQPPITITPDLSCKDAIEILSAQVG